MNAMRAEGPARRLGAGGGCGDTPDRPPGDGDAGPGEGTVSYGGTNLLGGDRRGHLEAVVEAARRVEVIDLHMAGVVLKRDLDDIFDTTWWEPTAGRAGDIAYRQIPVTSWPTSLQPPPWADQWAARWYAAAADYPTGGVWRAHESGHAAGGARLVAGVAAALADLLAGGGPPPDDVRACLRATWLAACGCPSPAAHALCDGLEKALMCAFDGVGGGFHRDGFDFDDRCWGSLRRADEDHRKLVRGVSSRDTGDAGDRAVAAWEEAWGCLRYAAACALQLAALDLDRAVQAAAVLRGLHACVRAVPHVAAAAAFHELRRTPHIPHLDAGRLRDGRRRALCRAAAWRAGRAAADAVPDLRGQLVRHRLAGSPAWSDRSVVDGLYGRASVRAEFARPPAEVWDWDSGRLGDALVAALTANPARRCRGVGPLDRADYEAAAVLADMLEDAGAACPHLGRHLRAGLAGPGAVARDHDARATLAPPGPCGPGCAAWAHLLLHAPAEVRRAVAAGDPILD